MTFSRGWDAAYREGGQSSVWPWSDLVSYVQRHARPGDGFRRVLELGCGAGANIPLFAALGVDYSAVEGSEYVVDELRRRFPEMNEAIVVGDFTKFIPFAGPFDLVVDRSSLTHNGTPAIGRALSMVFDRLRPGGKLLGLDWFSSEHSDAAAGERVDLHTRTSIPDGQFRGLGAVHFADREHLVGLLTQAGFIIDRLEHKRLDRVIPLPPARLAAWNFVAVKP